MNKNYINKKIQKFIKRDELLDETQIRIVKRLKNVNKKFEQLEGTVQGQLQAKNLNEMKNTYNKIMEELEEIEKDQNIQATRSTQKLKVVEKKALCFENILITEDNIINKSDRKNAVKKSLRLHLLKISGIYIDENTSPNIIKGFIIMKTPIFSMKSFEFNLSAISEEECMEKIWDLMKFTSYCIPTWEELFFNI